MKHSVLQLAALGGPPLFAQPLHVGQPTVPDHVQLLADLERVLTSGCLTNHGPQVRAFEAAICQVTGARHCIAVCNATIALQIVARCLELRGEVIVPAFTFIATAHALEWIGLTPVFADVDAATHTLDPASVEACISPATSAIVPVHLWGHVCDVRALSRLAERHQLQLFFDSSHAFGCRQAGVSTGTAGAAEVFSFHATKCVQSIEGGAIVTNHDDVAARCRRLRAFGITGLTDISDVGTNGKMHELSAAVGLRSIASLPEIVAVNQRNRDLYARQLQSVPGLRLLPVPDGLESNAHYVVAEVDEYQLGLRRDELLPLLRAEGVFVRSYFAPGCHRAAPYAQRPPEQHCRVPLPVTEHLLQTVMQFPTGPAVSADRILRIGQLLRFIQVHSAEIRRHLLLRGGCLEFHVADPARPEPPMRREAG